MAEDFEAARWNKKPDPKEHKPVDALKACLRAIDSGELDPEHVVIVYVTPGDNGLVGYFQAGKLNGQFDAMGLLTRATQIMGGGQL